MKFGLILSNTKRSKIYYKELIKNNLKPSLIIFLNNKKTKKEISKSYKIKNEKFIEFKSNNIDTKNISNYILNSKIINFVYSGYPGKIIRNELILRKKNIIHSHSGKLPEFPGSTTLYYMILDIKKIFCTTLILNKNLDKGKILLIKKYNFPKNLDLIENDYDNYIRVKNIIYIFKKFKYLIKNNINNKKNNFLPYYIAHPIIRKMVLKKNMLSKMFKKLNKTILFFPRF